MPKTYDIIQITDCHDTNKEGGLLAASKVELAYSALVENADLPTRLIKVVPAEEFNTIDVGAKFSELVTSSLNPARLIVAINAAPPSLQNGGKTGNDRKNFVLGKLKNGVIFGGTWGGHCLSYVKSQIAEVYELLDSNNGSQFRSLEVLPEALVAYAAGTIDPRRLGPAIDVANEVPNIPDQSHAWTIDNFRNVKLIVSDADKRRLSDVFAQYSAAKQAGQAAERPKVEFTFGDQSVEFGVHDRPTTAFATAALDERMFRGETGSNIFTLTSSARRWNDQGETVDVQQIATLRDQPHLPLGFQLPKIGAPLHIRVA